MHDSSAAHVQPFNTQTAICRSHVNAVIMAKDDLSSRIRRPIPCNLNLHNFETQKVKLMYPIHTLRASSFRFSSMLVDHR